MKTRSQSAQNCLLKEERPQAQAPRQGNVLDTPHRFYAIPRQLHITARAPVVDATVRLKVVLG